MKRFFTTLSLFLILILQTACSGQAKQESSPGDEALNAASKIYYEAKAEFENEQYDKALDLLATIQVPEDAVLYKSKTTLEQNIILYRQADEAYKDGDSELALEHLAQINSSLDSQLKTRVRSFEQRIQGDQARREREMPLEELTAYLQAEGVSDYAVIDTISRNANLSRLFATSASYKDDPFAQSKLLADLACYDVIAFGCQGLVHRGLTAAKETRTGQFGDARYGHDSDSPNLSFETVLLSIIELNERNDSAEDYIYLTEKLGDLVQAANNYDPDDPTLVYGVELPYYISLLAGYEPDPELFRLVYGDIADRIQAGTVEEAIINAPQAIKTILLNSENTTWRTEGVRPHIYTFEERDTLFKGFVPGSPEDIGYIYFADMGDRPEGLTAPLSVFAYENDTFFCPVNPARARISISEEYSYNYYGDYTVQGTSQKVPVYMPTVKITVTDLLSGETLLEDIQTATPEADYQIGLSARVYCPINFFKRGQYLKDALSDTLAEWDSR